MENKDIFKDMIEIIKIQNMGNSTEKGYLNFKSVEKINKLAEKCKQTKLYIEEYRPNFFKELNAYQLYLYLLDCIIQSPHKIYAYGSIVLLIPAIAEKIESENQ